MDETRFLELHSQGLPDMDIAEALLGNREKNTGQQVARLRKKYGLPSNKAKRGPKTDTSLDGEIQRLYQEEMLTCDQIAERTGRGSPFVLDRLKKLGIHEGRYARGRYGLSTNPPTDLEEIWISTFQDKPAPFGGVIAQGSAHRLGAHYGVSPQTATNWLKDAGLLKDRLPELHTWKALYEEGGMSCEAIAARVGVSSTTVSRYLKVQGVEVKNGYSYEEQQLREWIESLGVKVVANSRQIIAPKELDIYCPDQQVAIEYNGEFWHSGDKRGEDSAFRKTMMCQEKGIRLIHVWRHMWIDLKKRPIYENMIKHALGLTEHRTGGRKTRVEKRPAHTMRQFFEENNIQGYRTAKWAYVLVDKKTGLDLMCYTVGHAYFGKGAYDMEIARGACRLGWSVSGGATKLWKAIINDNPEVNSIVYYVDLNHYDGSSVSVLPGTSLIKAEPGLWNWWPRLGVMKNREPSRHAEIKEAYARGEAVPVWNAGTATYLWTRPPHL